MNWILRAFLDWLWDKISSIILPVIRYNQKVKDREKKQAEAKAEMERVSKDPSSTADDIAKAYENYVNSGR